MKKKKRMIKVDNNEYFFSKIYSYVHDELCNAMYARGYDIVWGDVCVCRFKDIIPAVRYSKL